MNNALRQSGIGKHRHLGSTIAYVGGAVHNASSNTSNTVTYTPTAGNMIVVFLNTASAITSPSCIDTNSNALTVSQALAAGTSARLQSFYGVAVTGATTYKCAWTTLSTSSVVIAEYSGVASVNGSLTGNTATSSTSPATITVTLDQANAWIACGLGSANTLTGTVGNTRQTEASTPKMLLMDNTSVTAGSCTVTATLTNTLWGIVCLELKHS